MERLVLHIEDDVELQSLISAAQRGAGREYLRARPVLLEFLRAADEIVGDEEEIEILRALLAEE